MTVAVQMDFPDATLEQYDRVLEKMGLTPRGRAPRGAISHFASKIDQGLRVIDVWETREAYDEFARAQIGPYSAEVGITTAPVLTFFDVHNYFTPGPSMDDRNKAVGGIESSVEELERLDDAGIRAWDEHDIDGFLGLFADQFVWRDVSMPDPITTRQGARDYMAGWFNAFPDMRSHTTHRVMGEHGIAAEVAFTGTNTGPLTMGQAQLPATGRPVIGRGSYFVRVENGKIIEFSSHPDLAGILVQLGFMSVAPAADAAPS